MLLKVLLISVLTLFLHQFGRTQPDDGNLLFRKWTFCDTSFYFDTEQILFKVDDLYCSKSSKFRNGFLKDNPKYKDSGMIGIIVNCKGEVVQCKMDNKTKSAELDKQIEMVFNSLGNWKAGKLDKKEVDSSKLYSFTIKNGKFSFD